MDTTQADERFLRRVLVALVLMTIVTGTIATLSTVNAGASLSNYGVGAPQQ